MSHPVTADAEIKVPATAESLKLLKGLSFKPAVGRSAASRASSAAGSPAPLISAFAVHSRSFPGALSSLYLR